MNGNIVGLVTSVLGILCGIIAVVCGAVAKIKKRNNEMRIRQSIIENHLDAETAKVLITNDEPKKKSPYATLRWGLALLGIGLGYFAAWILRLDDGVGQFVFMAGGCGVGLLLSFFISSEIEKENAKADDKTEQNR